VPSARPSRGGWPPHDATQPWGDDPGGVDALVPSSGATEEGGPVSVEAVAGVPAPALAGSVRRYIGYRLTGVPPGVHLGLPSRHLTVVLSLAGPVRMAAMPDPAQAPAAFQALAGGLATRPAVIVQDAVQEGVQLELTPAGARALLAVPAGALGPTVVGLEDLLGADARELLDRLAATAGWAGRFAVLDEVLARRPRPAGPPAAPLARAWDLLVASGGTVGVAELADRVGWSRRHLAERFRREYGVAPKAAARVIRFERSRALVQRADRPSLAVIAAACGYADQAHLAREWRDLAGCPPSAWLAAEDLPSVQAVAAVAGHDPDDD